MCYRITVPTPRSACSARQLFPPVLFPSAQPSLLKGYKVQNPLARTLFSFSPSVRAKDEISVKKSLCRHSSKQIWEAFFLDYCLVRNNRESNYQYAWHGNYTILHQYEIPVPNLERKRVQLAKLGQFLLVHLVYHISLTSNLLDHV